MDNISSHAKLRASRINSETVTRNNSTVSIKEELAIPVPESIFATSPKVIQIMRKVKPINVTGTGLIPPRDRQIMWKNLCMLGTNFIECIVEMS